MSPRRRPRYRFTNAEWDTLMRYAGVAADIRTRTMTLAEFVQAIVAGDVPEPVEVEE